MLSEIGVEEGHCRAHDRAQAAGIIGLCDKSRLVEKRKDAQQRLEAHIADLVR